MLVQQTDRTMRLSKLAGLVALSAADLRIIWLSGTKEESEVNINRCIGHF
jgi:hypothetical protein